MKLNRVNNFLENQVVPAQEDNFVINGPEVVKNIVVSNIIDITKLHDIESQLIDKLSKDINRLSRKEAQFLLRDIDAVSARKENFTLSVARDVQKDEWMKKIFQMAANEEQETVVSENGEVFKSSVTEEDKKMLKALLVDLLNDKTRNE